MAPPLNRNWYDGLIDDDGSGDVGTVWNRLQVDGFMDSIDASLLGLVDATDPRLTDARTPTLHAGTHYATGTDPISITQAQVAGLTSALSSKVETSDPRLSDARIPLAHNPTHGYTGTDPVDIAGLAGFPGDVALFLRGNRTWGSATGPTAQLVVREIPAGSVNGVNKVFTLAYVPVVGSEQAFLNGLLQESSGEDYTISGSTMTFTVPPTTGDRLRVTYQRN